MKVILNNQYGDCILSDFAVVELLKRKKNLTDDDVVCLYKYRKKELKVIKIRELFNLDFSYGIFILDSNMITKSIEIDDIIEEIPSLWELKTRFNREDKDLIDIIEKYGGFKCADDDCELKIVEIPDDVDYNIITTSEGYEIIIDVNRCWNRR